MQYMIRIELHDAKDESLYERLHTQAAAENLSRTLTDSATGEKSQALTGTYWTEAYSTWQDVMAAAKRAASTVHRSFGVMVAGDGIIHYYNCPLPQPKPRIGALMAASRRMTPPPTSPVPRRTLPSVFANSTVPVPPAPLGGLSQFNNLALLYETMLKAK